jgi:hypothetical protein
VDEAEQQMDRKATPNALPASSESHQVASPDVEPSAAPVDLVSYPNSVAVAASHTPFVVPFAVPFVVVNIRREETPGIHWGLTADSYFGGKPDTCSSDVL